MQVNQQLYMHHPPNGECMTTKVEGRMNWLSRAGLATECTMIYNAGQSTIIHASSTKWRMYGNKSGIRFYDNASNRWTLPYEYPQNIEIFGDTSAANLTRSKIWVSDGENNDIYCISIAEKDVTPLELSVDAFIISGNEQMVVIENKLHMVTGGEHVVYDIEASQKCVEQRIPTNWGTDGRLLNVNNELWLLHNSTGEIAKYSEKDQSWKIETYDKPFTTDHTDCIITANGKHIICLDRSGKIDILDIDNDKMIESRIDLPGGSTRLGYVGTILDTRAYSSKETVIIVSYLAKEVGVSIPEVIVKIINKHMRSEYLHVIGKDDNDHWRISMQSVLIEAEYASDSYSDPESDPESDPYSDIEDID
eukprot:110327_1